MKHLSFYLFPLFLIIVLLVNRLNSEEINTNTDTYLDALKNSHDIDTLSEDPRLAPTDYDQSSFYQSPTGPSSVGGGSYDYNNPKPAHVYGPPPQPTYGPPPPLHQSYGPPSSSPQHSYGPSLPSPYRNIQPFPPQSQYGPSAPQSSYYPSAPREENWFLNKFKLKFDLFTIGKILLKIIIFKKIVKFLALICLLLFLPKLYHHKHDNGSHESDSEERTFDHDLKMKVRVNEITNFAKIAFAAFAKKYDTESCQGSIDISCRFRKMFDKVDETYPYGQIIHFYLPNDDAYPEVHGELTAL